MKGSATKSGNWLIDKIGHWLTKDAPPKRAYLCDFERICFEIRPGDVLLIEGRNHISNVIKQVTQSPWSHSVLYLGRLHDIDNPKTRDLIIRHYHGPHDAQLIIESLLGKGTIISPITRYCEDHIRICRPQGLSRKDAQAIIKFAVNRLGRKYNVRHILDLFRFLFPWSLFPSRWRSTLFEHNALTPTHDICSSMIAEAFASVRFPILPYVREDEQKGMQLIQRNPKLFTPSDFDYSPYFKIIKYPIFQLSSHTNYRNLPWNEEGMISDDEVGLHKPKPEENKDK